VIGIGVVGLGRVLDYHLPMIEQHADDFRVVAVCDVAEHRRNEVAEQLGARPHASYEELLAVDAVDLVIVATPPTMHATMSIAALESGKHVIVEKPMALKADDARQMVEAAERSGKRLVVNHNHRFSGFFHYHEIKRELDRGAIGKPYQYTVRLLSPWGGYEGSPDYISNWECKKEHGGGTLFSWGPHITDLVIHTHGAPPEKVFARLNDDGWEFDGDSNALVVLLFADGATAEIEISYVSPESFSEFYVRGERGSLNYDAAGERVSLKTGAVRVGFEDTTVAREEPPADRIYVNLRDAIENGASLLIDPRDIHVVIATLEAATISSDEGRVVALSEVLGS
jgi:predicted dehydrogenase